MKCRNCKYLRWAEEYPGMPFFGWCDNVNDSPDMDMERECRCFESATHADIIRRMSDEELAIWLCEKMDCSICKRNIQSNGECDNYSKDGVSMAILNWLQKPAEEMHLCLS